MSITKACTVHVIAKLWPKLYAKITFNHEKKYLKWPNKFSGPFYYFLQLFSGKEIILTSKKNQHKMKTIYF